MKNLSVVVLVSSISFIAGAGLTYVAKTPWSSDMANQASIKPQERPILPPQGSVATDMVGDTNASAANSSLSQAGHQETGHQHGTSGAAGHQHDQATAKHDHGSKEKAQGMGHQHGMSGAGGHHHDGPGAKHDHSAKSVSLTKTKDSQPLPTDLMGSAGTGPGKTIQSPAGQQKAGDKSAGGHDHSSQKAPQAPPKGAQHNHTSVPHSHSDSGAHDRGGAHSLGHQHGGSATSSHGASGVSAGKEKQSRESGKPQKTKTMGSMQHSHGAAAHGHGAAGHSHGAGHGHAHGHDMQASAVKNPIKPTEASVKTGQKLFNIYCAVCHGNEGRGGAPMGSKLAGIPKFTAELLRSVDDNHMFSMVSSGHGPMPGYAEALTPEERWHVTNYVRTLQRKLADEQTASAGQGASR